MQNLNKNEDKEGIIPNHDLTPDGHPYPKTLFSDEKIGCNFIDVPPPPENFEPKDTKWTLDCKFVVPGEKW